MTLVVLPRDGATPDGWIDHPWVGRSTVVTHASDFLSLFLPYPDSETRDEAIAARAGDWKETVGPEAAEIRRRLE